MTSKRELDRILDVWLAEGPDHVPDFVFDNAVARLEHQPQARRWASPWRSHSMTTTPRLLAASVAAVAIIGAGLFVLRPSPLFGPPVVTAPPPSPSPEATVAAAQPLPQSGPVSPGRYFIPGGGPNAAVGFSFTMPAGWVAQGGGLVKHQDDSAREVGWGPAIVDAVFAEPCGTNVPTPVGPTVDELISALAGLPDVDVSDPLEVSTGGRVWQSIELTLPPTTDTASCDPPIGLQIWQDRSGDYLLVGDGTPAIVVVADVDGERFVIASSRHDTTPATDLVELDAIFASIEFDD